MRGVPFFIRVVLAGCLSLTISADAGQKALLVAINDYPPVVDPDTGKQRERDLNAPLNDLALMREVLLKLGYKTSDILTLTNGAATTAGISAAFEKQLVNGVTANDSVVFFFSGHGSYVTDVDGDESDGVDEVLITYDAKLEKPSSLLTDDKMKALIAKLPTKNAWIVIDSCHSGTAVLGAGQRAKVYPEGVLPKSDPLGFEGELSGAGAPIVGVAQKGLFGSKKRPYVFFGACQPDEEAWEGKIGGKHYSLFTLSLYQAITKNSGISLSEAAATVEKQVKTLSGNHAPKFQNPYLELNGYSGTVGDLVK